MRGRARRRIDGPAAMDPGPDSGRHERHFERFDERQRDREGCGLMGMSRFKRRCPGIDRRIFGVVMGRMQRREHVPASFRGVGVRLPSRHGDRHQRQSDEHGG